METRRPSWRILVPAVLAVVLVVSALAWWSTRDPAGDHSPTQAVESPSPSQSSSPSGKTSASPEVVAGRRLPQAARTVRRPGDPLRLVIPSLEVDAQVLPILAPGGVLTPPSDPLEIGWWADGSRPGDARGSALLTGHTVSTGGGALDDLERLADGDRIQVRSSRTDTGYAVRDVEVLSKGELAQRAEQLFDQSVRGRLVVITCEDWNGEEYLSNVVVTATPA